MAHCKMNMELAEKHLDKNDVFLFAYNIMKYDLNNITSDQGGRTLFHPADDFDERFWKGMLVKYGTGTVRYMDATHIHGKAAHCSHMEESFNFLMSCSLVVKELIDNTLSKCPFLEDIPICQDSFKGIDNCHFSPFLVRETDTEGGSCIFRNGVLLLGLDERLDIAN